MEIKKQQIKSTLSMLDYKDIVTDADKVCYDSSGTSLEATNVKEAIDKLSNAENIAYENEKLDADSVKQALDNIFDKIYPVGSIYMSMDNNFNPEAAFGGTWAKLESGRVLMSTDTNAGQKGGSESENYRDDAYNIGASFTGNSATLAVRGSTDGTPLELKHIPAHTHGVGSLTITNADLSGDVDFFPGELSHGGFVWSTSNRFTSRDSAAYYFYLQGTPNRNHGSATGFHFNGNHAHGLQGSTGGAGGSQAHNHSVNLSIPYTPTGTVTTSISSNQNVTISHMQPYITCYMWKRIA